ncbi:MAG: endonuclease III [Deltaproteobacteria bacterium]|nr:endonuclease III [Deltaproteobacteria bacterium]
MKKEKKYVEEIVKRLKKAYGKVGLALHCSNPLELLISLILAAQCTDERVNAVTAILFKKYRTAGDWKKIPLPKLETEIRSTGFYRNKTRSIHNCCTMLDEKYSGRVPNELEKLLELPGVGRKTANILLGNAFGKPAIGVDTHVGRVSQRLGLTDQEDPDKIEFDLNPLVPDRDKVVFCHLLQAHGRKICVARKPKCPECVLNTICPYPKKMGIKL